MENFSEWLTPQVIWFIVGLILILLEFMIPGVITVFFGVGAWIVSIFCLIIDIPLILQLIIFLTTSILMLILLRNWLKTIIQGSSSHTSLDMDELEEDLGKKAVVTEKIDPNSNGKVEFNGTSWQAEAYEIIEEGTPVEIVDKNNITLIVKPL